MITASQQEMPPSFSTASDKVTLVVNQVLKWLHTLHPETTRGLFPHRPLLIGINGPQGIHLNGQETKKELCINLSQVLEKQP